MDMEVWLQSLGVEPIEAKEVYNEQEDEYSVNIQQLFATKDEPKASHEHVDVVFALDTRSSISDADFTAMKQLIKDSSEKLFARGDDIRVYVDVQDCSASGIFTNSVLGGKYFTDSASLNSAVDAAGKRKVNSLFGEYVLSETLGGMLNRLDKERYTYLFTVADKNSVKAESNSIKSIFNACAAAADGFNASVVSVSADVNEYSFAGETVKATNGIVLSENSVDKVEKHVKAEKNEGNILLATSFKPLPEDYEEVTKKNDGDYDLDGLKNEEEYDLDKISEITGKEVTATNVPLSLPSIMDCSHYICTAENIDIIKNAFDKYCKGNLGKEIYNKLNTDKVLFITSYPTKVDSDGDRIPDCIKFYDTEEYQEHKADYEITEFDDPNPMKYEYLWQWPVASEDAVEEVNGKKKDRLLLFRVYF